MKFTRNPWSVCCAIAAAMVAGCLCFVLPTADLLAQNARGMPDGFKFAPRDLSKELANKTTGTYVVTAVGDVLMQEPMSTLMSPDLLQVLRGANTTIGNMEVYLVDRRNWAFGFGNNWSPKEMAKDYADMGFDMLVSGEGAGGEAGMRSSMKYLDEQGIGLAGYGANLAIARQPVFQYTTHGRIALVAAYPVTGNADWAQGLTGDQGYGLNPMRLTAWNVVTKEQLQVLKGIRDSIVAYRNRPGSLNPMPVPEDLPDRVTIFDDRYIVGPKTGEYHYEMNPDDHKSNVLAVRNAKEYADFSIFSMHVHQNRYAFQAYSQDNYPAKYLIDLTHEMVDNGMDMYIGHGNHTMQGIEIYKGRPIFYNLGNFSVHRFGADDSGLGPQTSIERGETGNQWLQQPSNLSAYVATNTYKDGVLQEIRIYPVDLGMRQSRPWSRTSVPMTPSPEAAKEILANVQKYSEPFGTKISIENGVGVIRVPKEATVPVGQNLRQPGGAQ